MIAVGSAGISKVMVGGTAAKAVYLGTTEVWTARSKVALKGVNAAYTALTVPIPAHQPGDLILVVARTAAGATLPTASGTVPLFTQTVMENDIQVAYAVATASNHTSGQWREATPDALVAAVLSGQRNPSPIGGINTSKGRPHTAPAVTLADSTGLSQLLHFMFFNAPNGTSDSWEAAPAGYTVAYSSTDGNRRGIRVLSKDSTTTDGVVTNGVSGDLGKYGAVFAGSVEVVAKWP